MTTWIEGIVDLSHWQADPDFVAMKHGGTMAVILKATQGSKFVDPTFVRRSGQAKAAGLLVGAYHFCDASSLSNQLSMFLRIASWLPVLALDVEANGVGATINVTQAAMMVSMLQSATGRAPLLYMSRWGPDGKATGLPNGVLSRCPLWLPEYGSNPVPPRGWAQPMIWQYTDAGRVVGSKDLCDLNRWSGTPETLHAFWNG